MMEWLGKAIILNSSGELDVNKVQPQVLTDDTTNLKIVHMMKPLNTSVIMDGVSSLSDAPSEIDFKYIARQRKPYEFPNTEIVDQFTIELPVDNITLEPDVLQDIKIISNHRNGNILCVDMKEYLQDDIEGNVPTLCRVCACESKVTSPLFKDDGSNVHLIEKIHQYLPIKILPDDDLPQQVCDTCILKLELCHNFFLSSAEADAKLRSQSLAMKESCKLLDADKLDQALNDISSIKIVEVHSSPSGLKELPFIDQGPGASEMEMNLIDPVPFTDLDKQLDSSVQPVTPDPAIQDQLTCSKELPQDAPEEQTELPINLKPPTTECNPLVCKFCNKEFKTEVRRIKHEKVHSKRKKKVNCFVCEQVLPNRIALRTHLKTEHNQTRVYPCDICGKTYSLLSSLDIHRATHSKETPYLCDLCGKKFKHISNLRSHKRSHLDETIKKRYPCEHCPKTFHSKFQLSEHMNVHNDKRPYPCRECGKNFHRRIQLRQHLLTHSGENFHECPQCGLRFNRKGNMTQHLKRHAQEKSFLCKVCRSSFPSMVLLLAHRRLHTKEEIENQVLESNLPFRCKTCYKSFSKSELYEEHLKLHADEQEFECSICNKKLSSKRTLDYHIRSFHTGEKLYSCNFCGESFSSKRTCVVHERIHTGEKPYKCDLCPMAFRCGSSLTQHQRTHTEEKPWSCEQCDKHFKRKEALVIHQRSHTGERPFCCDKCGRRFFQRNDMMRHQRNHCTEPQAVACTDCGISFKERRSLNKHIKKVHSAVILPDNNVPVSILASQAVVITTTDSADVVTPFPISVVDGIILQHVDESGRPISAEEVYAGAALVPEHAG